MTAILCVGFLVEKTLQCILCIFSVTGPLSRDEPFWSTNTAWKGVIISGKCCYLPTATCSLTSVIYFCKMRGTFPSDTFFKCYSEDWDVFQGTPGILPGLPVSPVCAARTPSSFLLKPLWRAWCPAFVGWAATETWVPWSTSLTTGIRKWPNLRCLAVTLKWDQCSRKRSLFHGHT